MTQTSTGELALRVVDAHKRFGETQALDGANLELRKGEWLGLLGPNGAGKTTLVRALAGRVALDQGTLEMSGEDLSGERGDVVRAKLGVVPQEVALFDTLSARENLSAWARLAGLAPRRVKERVQWALEWTGLAERADDRTEGFSGGMKRRLNLACGVLHDPEVVLLDEPTVGVDPQSRERIWEMLQELNRQGTSLLLTTHQLDEAQEVCQRITIVDRGKDIASGSFEDLVRETLGQARRIEIVLAEPVDSLPEGVNRLAPNRLEARIHNLARDLPRLLEACASAGASVENLEVVQPTLQNVFLHLTGRELRE